MRVVLQRCRHASCTIDGVKISEIKKGYCLFVGFFDGDTEETVNKMVKKIINLRIFEDENGKMNESILNQSGSILSISQFTLYANAKKGNRPSFIEAARPETAIPLYDAFNELLAHFVPVQTGRFGADMKIDLCNDGPVTILLDSEVIF